ncbi:aldehyde dehydrogenase family protein, partial [Escherichia coli]|nr:aldehyde dehydrogenase family protein [Escherichia coli]
VKGEGEKQPVYNPATGEVLLEIAEASPAQVDAAVLAADRAFSEWGQTTPKVRSELLLKLADVIEQNAHEFAELESRNCGKPLHCVLNDEIPAIVDVFRFFAGAARCLNGLAAGEYLEGHTSMIRRDPVGVVASIAPWNYPLMMAAWKLAPALAAGNCVVLKPAEQTPLSITLLMEIIGDLFPAGVLNVVQGFGKEAGEALATSKRIAKIAFTGSTPVGRHIMACAAENIIPCTVELGGKSPNIYFADVMDGEEEFIEKAVEGLVLGFFNQGEVCTCPSRALIHESIYEPFMERVMAKVMQIRRGDPFDTETMIGAQASRQQFDKILSYIKIARDEGGQILTGGDRASITAELDSGFYIQPTLIKGHNEMRSFQEEIFGPVI